MVVRLGFLLQGPLTSRDMGCHWCFIQYLTGCHNIIPMDRSSLGSKFHILKRLLILWRLPQNCSTVLGAIRQLEPIAAGLGLHHILTASGLVHADRGWRQGRDEWITRSWTSPQDTRSRYLVRRDSASACAATRNHCAAAAIVRFSTPWTCDCDLKAKVLLTAQMVSSRDARVKRESRKKASGQR